MVFYVPKFGRLLNDYFFFKIQLAFTSREKSKVDDFLPRQAFVETYLSYPTKTEQFTSFRKFGDEVMNLGDAHDKGVLTGEKNARNLEHKLAKVF